MKITLTPAECTHILALLLQYSIANRTDSVSRQINHSLLREIEGLLDDAEQQALDSRHPVDVQIDRAEAQADAECRL